MHETLHAVWQSWREHACTSGHLTGTLFYGRAVALTGWFQEAPSLFAVTLRMHCSISREHNSILFQEPRHRRWAPAGINAMEIPRVHETQIPQHQHSLSPAAVLPSVNLACRNDLCLSSYWTWTSIYWSYQLTTSLDNIFKVSLSQRKKVFTFSINEDSKTLPVLQRLLIDINEVLLK